MKPTRLSYRLMSRFPRFRWTEVAFAALAIVLMWRLYEDAEIIWQLRGNVASLSRELEMLARRRIEVERDLLHYKRIAARSSLDPSITLHGVTLESSDMFVRFSELRHPVLLYTVDPDCLPCMVNLPFINRISTEKTCGTRVVGIAVADWDLLDQFSTRILHE